MPVESNPHLYQTNGHAAVNGSVSPTPVVASEDNELAEFVQIIRRRMRLFGGVAIAVSLSLIGWTLTRTPVYRGSFQLLVEPITESDPSRQLLQDEAIVGGSSFDYATQLEVLRSPARLNPILDELQEAYPDFTYGELLTNLQISRLRDTKVLAVSYEGQDPERIQTVLDALSQSFLDYSFEQRQVNLRQGISFVDEQLPELRERVDTLQSRLERFRQEYSLLDPETRGGELSGFISGVEQQRQETQTALVEARSLYTNLQRQLGLSDRDALLASTLSESPRYQSLLNQLREVETEIATESARFQPDSPNVVVLQDRRNSLLPLLDAEAERLSQNVVGGSASAANGNLTPTALELSRELIQTANQVRQLEARNEALAGVEQRLKEEFAIVPALSRQYTELQRELSVATDSLNRFLATRETLQIEAAQNSIPWELIAAPNVSGSPISPNVPRNLMLGAIAGLVTGSVAAILVDKLDRVVHTVDELKALTPLPLLGIVPYRRPEQAAQGETPTTSNSDTEAVNGDSTAPQTAARARYYYTTSPFIESFRSLYTNLRFLGSDAPIRSLVISSPSPAEGKSTVTINLAKAAAAMGQRVLMVDADLRCPILHERLSLLNLRGLSDCLTGAYEVETLIKAVEESPNLHVLTAGTLPPDPTTLLSSRRMHSLMQHLASRYHLVIYDVPPMLGFADTPLLAAHADGLMMVVALGKTQRHDITQTLDLLRLSPINVLGMISNGLRPRNSNYYKSTHYNYQRYYSPHAAQQKSGIETASATILGRFWPQMRNGNGDSNGNGHNNENGSTANAEALAAEPPTPTPSPTQHTPPPPPPATNTPAPQAKSKQRPDAEAGIKVPQPQSTQPVAKSEVPPPPSQPVVKATALPTTPAPTPTTIPSHPANTKETSNAKSSPTQTTAIAKRSTTMLHVGHSATDEEERSPYLLRLIVIAGVGATLLILLVLQLASHWRSRSEAPEPTPAEDSLTLPDAAPVEPSEPTGDSLVEPPGAETVEEPPSEESAEEADNLLNPFIAPPME
ncbi:MAG: polysaccharide biosynthesis tyrosine autokinase [Cyanobacteria bacterium J06638_20]